MEIRYYDKSEKTNRTLDFAIMEQHTYHYTTQNTVPAPCAAVICSLCGPLSLPQESPLNWSDPKGAHNYIIRRYPTKVGEVNFRKSCIAYTVTHKQSKNTHTSSGILQSKDIKSKFNII